MRRNSDAAWERTAKRRKQFYRRLINRSPGCNMSNAHRAILYAGHLAKEKATVSAFKVLTVALPLPRRQLVGCDLQKSSGTGTIPLLAVPEVKCFEKLD